MEQAVGPYRPWDISVHDGGREAQALAALTDFLEHHLKAVQFLMNRCDWDLFMYDLMATDRFQHEMWHVWDDSHRARKGQEARLDLLKPGCRAFWETLDRGIGAIAAALPADTALILMSDHGFGPIEHYVNFNVWLLQRGDIALQDSLYVRQKRWFYERGLTPETVYNVMIKLGLADQRVSRFRGKQTNALERFAESAFLSRRHIDWSKTRAYSQGNFGQIYLNLKGRQPFGCIEPADARAVLDDLKAGLMAIPNPETGAPLIARIYERDELYHGPHAQLAPDLTVVPDDWRYRTIGLHDFTTNRVISPAFGPTGDHRMEGVFIAQGPAFHPGATLADDANLLDIAPTILRLLGVPLPADLDGRVLTEVLDPRLAAEVSVREPVSATVSSTEKSAYSDEEDAAIQQRLADLGYL